MRRIIAIGILVFCMSLSGLHAQTVRLVSQASTSPSPPYTSWSTASHTIQAVIDVCNTGDTILVDNGTYTEILTIDQDLTLQSYCLEPQTCIISAPAASSSPVVTIADPTLSTGVITVRGFTITGDAPKGIYIADNETATGNYPVVANCIIRDFPSYGLHAFNANFTLEFSTVVDNATGVFLDNCASGSWVRYNIIASNTVYGLHAGASTYLSLEDNCYFDNGSHLFGLPSAAWCDKWSADVVAGIDPMFVDPDNDDFHLGDGSPCIDFNPGDYGYSDCARTLYDRNESPFDLGAYGGNGQSPTSPNLDSASRSPTPGTTRVAANAPISFTIRDTPAGIDLSTLTVTISDHGYAPEVFDQTDLTILDCPVYGAPYATCGVNCLNVTLPGSAHQPFVTYSNVRVTIDFYDRCPTPNHYFNDTWRFRADDLVPPVMLPDHYPANGATDVRLYGPINIGFTDSPGVGIRQSTLQISLNGTPLSLGSATWASGRVTLYPTQAFTENATNTLTVRIADIYYNYMADQTITFSTALDNLPPFVPGVTTPVVPTPGPTPYPVPTIGPVPAPAPLATDVDPNTSIQFSLQDFESTLDVSDMTVVITTGLGAWTYTDDGAGGTQVFQLSGSAKCQRIQCAPVANWGENETVSVQVSQGADTALTPNVQDPAAYTFETGYLPVPAMGTVATLVALVLMGLGLLVTRKR